MPTELFQSSSDDTVNPASKRPRVITIIKWVMKAPGAKQLRSFLEKSDIAAYLMGLPENLVTIKKQFKEAREELEKVKAERDQYKENSLTDALTGLNNRRFVEGRLEALQRTDGPVGMLTLDLDHFKNINDTYGHDIGDLALKHVADILKKYAGRREGDTLGRIGGEEFVVIYSGVKTEEALFKRAEFTRQKLEENPLIINGQKIDIKASVGTAFTGGDHTKHDLLKRSDDAAYQAKRHGRNRTIRSVYIPALNDEGKEILNDKNEKQMKVEFRDVQGGKVEYLPPPPKEPTTPTGSPVSGNDGPGGTK